ncbi:MAG: recombinase family protein [Pseudonocardiaceae bacterium]
MDAGQDYSLSSVTLCTEVANSAKCETGLCGLVGYARAPSPGLRLNLMANSLSSAGCSRVETELARGATVSRPIFESLIASLPAGSALVVTSLEQLVWREDLLRDFVGELSARGIHLVSLDEEFDTRVSSGAVEVLRALSHFADNVRVARETEASDGNRKRLSSQEWTRLKQQISAGSLTKQEAADLAGVNVCTIYRRLND